MKIAIIGAGVSGIGTAIIMKKAGHEVILFEKADKIGGVWANCYPKVSLQNIESQYHFSDFPWPTTPSLHPKAEEIYAYLNSAVQNFELDIRYNHQVVKIEENETLNGWNLLLMFEGHEINLHFDFVVSSIGQYSGPKNVYPFVNQDLFKGEVLTERDIDDFRKFKNRRVAVVGYGKSALDMASLSQKYGAHVIHIFRTPRWTVPYRIMGIHYSHAFFSRLGSIMMNSWVQTGRLEIFLHKRMRIFINIFWKCIECVLAIGILITGLSKGRKGIKRVCSLIPKHPLTMDLRSAAALRPKKYVKNVASGKIKAVVGEIHSFISNGVRLNNGTDVAADVVILSLGSSKPEFPFLPSKFRKLLESDNDGVQLYRHMIHPGIQNFAFAGYNHGFLHISAVEVGAVWLCALLDKDIQLPSKEEMTTSIEKVKNWKRKHINYEPSRLCAVNTRYQQYLDLLMRELGLSPYRKSNLAAEIFSRYTSGDYKGVYEDYKVRKRKEHIH